MKSTIIPAFNGFRVTTEAYRAFSITNDVQTKILPALKVMDIALPAPLESASATIGNFFAQSEIPPDIAESICGSYEALLRSKNL